MDYIERVEFLNKPNQLNAYFKNIDLHELVFEDLEYIHEGGSQLLNNYKSRIMFYIHTFGVRALWMPMVNNLGEFRVAFELFHYLKLLSKLLLTRIVEKLYDQVSRGLAVILRHLLIRLVYQPKLTFSKASQERVDVSVRAAHKWLSEFTVVDIL